MKRLCAFFLTLATLLGCVGFFSSCAEKDVKAPEGVLTRVEVDINPSVELMVDDENKIVSVTALNDDGSILIAGETFVGLSAEEGVNLVVSLATETGYLVKGSAEADQNEVKISVSGDTAYAEQLKKEIKASVKKVIDEAGIRADVTEVKTMALDRLRSFAVEIGAMTEEEAATATEKDLYTAIAAQRIETAELLTQEMQKAYLSAKEYRISFAEREETAKIIEGMGSLYSLARVGYNAAVSAYEAALTALENVCYEMLVSPDSAYQKALATLREKKADLLAERKLVASVSVNDEKYVSYRADLTLSEEQYDKALEALEKLGEAADLAWDKALTVLKNAEAALKKLEESFPDSIKEKLTEKAAETENAVNQAKANFFTEFEKAHADDIAAAKQALVARKNALKKANAD